MKADSNLWYDKNLKKWYSHPNVNPEDAYDFMERQLNTNISMRGWLETSYYYLGSAQVESSTLDYMSQMAGWSILDYAIYYSDEPAKYARLGYASILSSWALINSGTPETNYGYWYPGKENDGAVGWNFQTLKYGDTWGVDMNQRGIWKYCGEIDHGFAGGLNSACTVVMDDPIFGKIAYGGKISSQNEYELIVPQDGVRRRLHYLVNDHRLHIELDGDGFAKNNPVLISRLLDKISFTLENRSGISHKTGMKISGMPHGFYSIEKDNETISEIEIINDSPTIVNLNIGEQDHYSISLKRIHND